MRYKRQTFEDSGIFEDQINEGHSLEKLFYEVRPILFMVIALVALKNNVDASLIGKLSSFTLLGISGFILYTRMSSRGHLK